MSRRENINNKKREITINPVAPFDFDLTLGVYGSFGAQSVDIYSHGCFKRVLSARGKNYLVTANSSGTVRNPIVTVFLFPPAGEEGDTEERLVERFNWMIGTELSLAPFYDYVEKEDSTLFQITQKLFGLKPPRTPSVFEALIIAITEQQTTLAVASKLRGSLAKLHGESILVDGCRYYAFPTPEALANASAEDIRKLGFNSRKASCIVEVAQRARRGELDLEKLSTLRLESVVETLTQIKGIGRWTVEYTMCRGMGRYEALPANDAVLKAAISKYYKRLEVSEKDVRELLERFNNFKGYAALYLIFAYALEKYRFDPRAAKSQSQLESWLKLC